MNEPVVIMTYQEKIWYDFIERNPEFVIWSFYALFGIIGLYLLVNILWRRFERAKKNKWLNEKFNKFME